MPDGDEDFPIQTAGLTIRLCSVLHGQLVMALEVKRLDLDHM